MKIAFLFPGQGSQSVGMGADLAANIKASFDVFEEANSYLGYKIDSLCFYGPADRLSQTDITQPALFTVSVAALKALEEQGVEAEAVAGHSVGEYAALFAAGSLDFATGLQLVSQRALAMNRATASHPGEMVAIIGLETSVIVAICQEISALGTDVVVPANFNGPGQVVISGNGAGVQAASRMAKDRGARKVIALSVSGGFHSPLMEAAASEMRVHLDGTRVDNARIPVVANVTANYETDAVEIQSNLTAQINGPVRWEESMLRLVNDGFDFFIEIGSGAVLSGLMKRISTEVRVYSVADTKGLYDAVAATKS